MNESVSDEVLFADQEVTVIIQLPKLQKSDLAVSKKVLLQWVLVCMDFCLHESTTHSLSSMHSIH